jgi:hypothetical protein
MPTMDRGTLYDFSTGPVSTGMSGDRLGASVESNQNAWPRMADPRWRYTGLRGANIRRGRYAYTGLLGDFGDAQSDARTALATAQSIRDMGMASCSLITNATDKARCEAGVNAAYAASRAAIVAGYGTDGTYPPSSTPSQATREQISEKLRLQAERTGVEPPASLQTQSDNTMLYVGGILVVGVLAALYIMKG